MRSAAIEARSLKPHPTVRGRKGKCCASVCTFCTSGESVVIALPDSRCFQRVKAIPSDVAVLDRKEPIARSNHMTNR